MENIIREIEKECPLELAYSWDNSGFLIGRRSHHAKKALIALDVTPHTVQRAIEAGADVIVSHHPVIFSSMKQITNDVYLTLIEHGICVYSAHTSLDNAKHGINARLAELFKLTDVQIIDKCDGFDGCGLGRVGVLPEPISIDALCELVKERLHTPFVRTVHAPSAPIERIAVMGGSCSEFIPRAAQMGAQAVITGDMKYHDSLDAPVCVIDAGHFPTEHIARDILREFVSRSGVETVVCDEEDVFKLY